MESIAIYLSQTFTVTKLKMCLSVLYSWFAYIVWWIDLMVQSMYVLLILDFVLGFAIAWQSHTISKKKMQLGIVKIVTYSLTLIVIHYADIATMSSSIAWVWIREIGVWYLAINEALSCLKHLSSFWVPLPWNLIAKLEWYRDNLNSKDFK